jgi:predicted Zn-dependent protease
VLLRVDVRYIFAKSLRQYDQKYEKALAIAAPLVERYPQNPIFLLLVGNLKAELGRNDKASEYFQAVLKISAGSADCAARVRELATSFLNSLH